VLITETALLEGKIRYRQPAVGFRSGLEPILLSAAVPLKQNERVLEAGTGAGAALLCLGARCETLVATGVEIDPSLAEIAASNVTLNQFRGIQIVCDAMERAELGGPYDHAISNPPYHDPYGTKSPIEARERAKRGSVEMLVDWIARIAASLRYRGTLTLILPTWLIPTAISAMHQASCPCTHVFPLWPKKGKPAKLILLRGIRHARAPMQLAPGLTLHRQDGTYTKTMQAILRGDQLIRLTDQNSPAVG
jgi:tRNA1Val (adenine37-N6)-methyltransferase